MFVCISRHLKSGVAVEDTDVFIGPTGTLPTHRVAPYSIGMIVDGFLSFKEAKIICDWAHKNRSGARQLAHAFLAVCQHIEAYRPVVDINVLLGLQNMPYRVTLDRGIIHLSPSPRV